MTNSTYFISSKLSQYFFMVMIASLFLNINAIHYQPLALWAKILPPVLLSAGLFIGLLESRILRVCGWIGILMFFAVSFAVSFPSEDYVLGGPEAGLGSGPKEVSTVNICSRVLVGLSITSLLFYTYRRIRLALSAQP